MDDITIILIVCIVIFLLLIKGVVKTFQRQPIVAILCIIFLFPVYALWAFCELFTGAVRKN
jgi:Ca2+/Na+ antiporter